MKAKTYAVAVLVFFAASAAAFAFGGHTSSKQTSAQTSASPGSRRAEEVYAVWYRVPPDSLARRRAGVSELTAAHNRLPIGTLVRVTNLKNGKSVLVRITDRGIPKKKRAKIDICKEAAEKIDMLSEGTTKVRLEIVAEAPSHAAAAAAVVTTQVVPK